MDMGVWMCIMFAIVWFLEVGVWFVEGTDLLEVWRDLLEV